MSAIEKKGKIGLLTLCFVGRAIETQSYVLASAQYGRHNEKRESFGHSLAVDPWGRVLADAGGYNNHDNDDDDGSCSTPPSIVVCDIDLDALQQIRQRMPISQHRKAATIT